MIILDIDNTISPTEVTPTIADFWKKNDIAVTEAEAVWMLTIPNYVLDFIRDHADDVYFLSTWGESASAIVEAFNLEGVTVLDMYATIKSRKQGIQRKAAIIEHFGDKVEIWADDHILPSIAKNLSNKDMMTVRPRSARGEHSAVISPKQIAGMRDFLKK